MAYLAVSGGGDITEMQSADTLKLANVSGCMLDEKIPLLESGVKHSIPAINI